MSAVRPTSTRGDTLKAVRQRAEQGDAAAQWNLGFMYSSGQGLPQDDGQAVEWYRKAAEQGNAGAQHSLALAHFKGRGTAQDSGQAAQWNRRAAEQGFVKAQFNLAQLCFHGSGVPQDYAEAHKWMNLTSTLASGELQRKSATARELLAEKMTPAQIAEAQKRARDWQEAFEKRKK
jgi:uncharacterized protein